MEQQLLIVTTEARLTPKGHKSRVVSEPFRTVLLSMQDSGLRSGELFRMRWENIYWDRGLIINPAASPAKSRHYVLLTERVKAALLMRKEGENEAWVFPSKSPIRPCHRSRGFQAVAGSQTIGGYSWSGRLVRCSGIAFQLMRWRVWEIC
jgi:integrase